MRSRLWTLSGSVVCLFTAFTCALPLAVGADPEPKTRPGTLPTDDKGKPLNLDFETGDLKDWKAEGTAFNKQPIQGDTVNKRRGDMKSEHTGKFWVGTYEIALDAP